MRISCGLWPLPFPHALLQWWLGYVRIQPLGRSDVASSPSAVLAVLAMLDAWWRLRVAPRGSARGLDPVCARPRLARPVLSPQPPLEVARKT